MVMISLGLMAAIFHLLRSDFFHISILPDIMEEWSWPKSTSVSFFTILTSTYERMFLGMKFLLEFYSSQFKIEWSHDSSIRWRLDPACAKQQCHGEQGNRGRHKKNKCCTTNPLVRTILWGQAPSDQRPPIRPKSWPPHSDRFPSTICIDPLTASIRF